MPVGPQGLDQGISLLGPGRPDHLQHRFGGRRLQRQRPGFPLSAATRFTGHGFGHAVADPRLGHDVGGAGGNVAQLAAEFLHEGAHEAGVTAVLWSPDPSQQVLVRQDPSGIDRQCAEQVVLGDGELDRPAGHGHPAFLVVNGQVPQPIGFGRRVPPAQGRLDSRHQLRRRKGFDDVVGGTGLQGLGNRLVPAVLRQKRGRCSQSHQCDVV